MSDSLVVLMSGVGMGQLYHALGLSIGRGGHGKALYADQVGTHFPLTNFLIAAAIERTGATVSSVVIR